MELKMKPVQVTSNDNCPVCDSAAIEVFLEASQVPIHCNLLCSTRTEALATPRGDIRLAFCSSCGHVFNLCFNPDLMSYGGNYENSLHFSPSFQSYATQLARRLIDRYDLKGKKVIEIGCGQGDFLTLLCKCGASHGLGFDPGYAQKPTDSPPGQVAFIRDFYSERYANYETALICCRHVLEHIYNPVDFLKGVRRAIDGQRSTVVYFEVPNALFTLRDLAIWDIIYEHCSYFTSHSLTRLFTACGFSIRDLTETFNNQFLSVEALPGDGLANSREESLGDMTGIIRDVAAFAEHYQRKLTSWQCHVERIIQASQRAVVWGAGSKGVSFLNALRIQDQIEYAVDINPRKHGMYIAGTGQQILLPEFLRTYQPDVVIVMNAAYGAEIREITSNLGVSAEFVDA